MQCGCPNCGVLMAKVERGMQSRCICPNCGHECEDCLGMKRRFPERIEKGGKIPPEILRRYEEEL